MKITPFGRGTVLELRSDHSWSNGHPMVLNSKDWYDIDCWCRQNKIYYKKSGNTISFTYERDATAFVLKFT